MSTGDKILKLMDDKKVSRLELSNTLNINYQTLCKYLQNKRSIPGDILVNIANYFDVTLDYLLDRDGLSLMESIDYNHIELAKEIENLNEDDKELVKNLIRSLIDIKSRLDRKYNMNTLIRELREKIQQLEQENNEIYKWN